MHDENSSPKTYRDAMARYAGHVQIVTTAAGGMMRGVTATACTSVSDAPPTVLACVNRHNPRNGLFAEAGNFAINTLGTRHRALADAFSGLGGLSTEQRFAEATWDLSGSGAPVLVGALASFDCRLIEAREVASHWILIGEVIGVRLGDADKPLIYFDRGYCSM
ncbi:flavin reductase family protein [Martelella endophytica]|uniref:4-hydroxyphenylacetate 3-monooxygenase n=1 Tax=Martelella endophytica TaxID=1486262 RepID=A0A0D5LRK2_MAREN|nr:flavin reductase family protein [Martelella endophytica]AJY46570.1 4-hydroxyphenylacetate 3-monooxygenase [Martelella endophytica]